MELAAISFHLAVVDVNAEMHREQLQQMCLPRNGQRGGFGPFRGICCQQLKSNFDCVSL